VALILGSQTSDVYTFTTNVFIYSGNWIKLFLGIGLLYLTWTPSEKWREERTTFKSFPILTIFWCLSLMYVIAAPFIPNKLPPSVPFYVVPTLGTSLLAIGTAYWLLWAKVLPLFGFHIQHEIEQLPDGSERVRYIVSWQHFQCDTSKSLILTRPIARYSQTAEEEKKTTLRILVP
jgi:phosphatidylinositol 4-kinase